MLTLEDYIEILANFRTEEFSGDFVVSKSDYNLIHSLARQSINGIGFTDRQMDLVKKKVLEYKDLFVTNNIQVSDNLDRLRNPIREIDRSRWIKIVDSLPNIVYEASSGPFIAVRFVFNKKLITALEGLRSEGIESHYDKENKIHYYSYSERNLFTIVNILKDKNFDMDDKVQQIYEVCENMNNNKSSYIPGVYNLKLRNLNKNAIDYIISDIGSPSIDNLALLRDRKQLYGLEHFDDTDLEKSYQSLSILSKKIITRTKKEILVNKTNYTLDNLIESMLELYRLPILFILDSTNDFDNLVESYNSLKNILPRNSFSVLYRKENKNKDEEAFNAYIKENSLNASLDTNPKIVYTSIDKFPKTLLKTHWKPRVVIVLGDRMAMQRSKYQYYINDNDLVVHYRKDDKSTYAFELQRIEKI